MPRHQLPTPVTGPEFFLAALVDRVDQVVGLLTEVRDRLPQPVSEPAGDVPGGPGAAPDAVPATEPAPVRRPTRKTPAKDKE